MAEVKMAPFRPLDDYLLESARFQPPDFADPERWANRVMNNLLYYQTNYFFTIIVVHLLIGLMNPGQMLVGLLAICSAFAIFVALSNNRAELRHFKRHHPVASSGLIVAACYAIMYLFGSIMVFLFGIALPLALVLVHASTRMRNTKSKITTKLEKIGFVRTPMGLLLEALGQEQEMGS